jgi:hypothetical protein
MGVGPFSSSSESTSREYNFGNVTAEGGGVSSIVIGKGNLGPGATLYKVAKGGSINLSVTSTGSPGGAGTVLANAIEKQAGGAFGSSPAAAEVPGVDRKTLFVGLAVALALFGVLFFFRRR